MTGQRYSHTGLPLQRRVRPHQSFSIQMSATFRWIVERRLLTLAGFGVILLGAFIPWPSLAVAAVVIVLGAVLLAVQIPVAMRDATEQLDGVDEPEEQWQAPAYPQYQPEPYQQPTSLQPEPSPRMVEHTPLWQPRNIPRFQQSEPYQQPETYRQPEPQAQPEPHQQPAPLKQTDEPVVPWRPKNIPQY